MAVTSTTLGTAAVPVFQLSGVVTDAELGTALASTILNGVYVTNRALYVDQTADLTQCTGGFLIDFGTQVLPAIILHTSRDRTKSVFRNFTFLQRTGLSVTQRSGFVQTWNGSSFANAGSGLSVDGLAQSGGGFIYGVPGVNPAGGDNRWLNEMAFAGPMADNTISSQQFTQEELQVCMGASTTIKGMTFEKAYGFPQLSPALANANVTIYRSNQNTESLVSGGLVPIRLFPQFNRWASACYVDSYVTRQGGDILTRLANAFGSTTTSRAHFTVLNNYTRESWFGASKTNIAITSWGAANTVHGGVLKKLRFVDGAGGVIRSYDSRSTTAAQRTKFAETGFFDFLEDSLAPEVDSEGRIQLVHIGAIATGLTAVIARYTGQKYTFQKFGKRVLVADVDMTGGDNDLSAFTPIILTDQNGLVRDLAAINAATSIETYRELLEELHALSTTLVGAASYNAPYGGNLFELSGNQLNTAFSSVLVDKTAAQKISYDSATGALVIRSNTLASGLTVSQWSNSTGPISTANGATITGVYADINGQRVRVFNLNPEGFDVTWYLRHRVKGTTEWTNLSGPGNETLVILSAGEYEFQVRVPGYDWDDAEIDTTVSLSLDMALRYQVSANNTPQYTMAFDATLEAIFQYDAVAMQVSVENETGAIIQPGFAELYQATQRIQHIPDLVWTWTSPVTANATSQKILIPTGNPISMYLTDTSTNSVKITCPVIHADTGQSADDRVRGNPAGFSIILGSPATAESAGLAAQIISGLGGAGYTESEASQVALKALIDEVQALVGQVKARTDLVPDEPAAVGDAMTLTTAYDAAKTAATQTSVDSVATAVTALGEPLQAADYVEPATAEAIATQVEVQIINDDDGRAVLQAIADKIMAEEISSTVIAQSVRAELATELGRIDVAISTRSTLTAEDIPEGLTAAEVWSADTRTLTEAAGLTTEQAAQLAALPTLADIEGTTVLAKAADLADLATSDQVTGLATQASVDALAGDVPTASETAAAVLGATVETGATVVQSLRLANAVLAGKVSGGQTGVETFRDLADTKDVIVSTNDVAGNRTAVTKNLG